jgi:peptidyl-prolyl cis-trans isomerase C/peptidyl-prolyl cis-trans isomerase D
MERGHIKGLVETQFGYHILQLIDRRSYELADKRQIRLSLFETKRAQIFNNYFSSVKKKYKVNIDAKALQSLKK